MKHTRLAAGLIVLVGVCVYGNSVRGAFIWDDQTAVLTNQSIRHLWPDALFPPSETPVAGRPIPNLSLALNYAAGGFDATGYHVWNVSVHVVCALLLFGIVRRTLILVGRDEGRERQGRKKQRPLAASTRPDVVAAVVALIWMVHPLTTEAVDYISQRTESMMACFFLLTLYCAIRRWTVGAIVACALGMATKESMVVAPIVVVLYDRIFLFDSFRDAARERRGLYAGLGATWIALALLMSVTGRSTVGNSATIGAWTYLLNQARMIAHYLWTAIWPNALILDYGLPQPLTLGDVAGSAACVVGLVVASAVALARWPRIGFLAATFFLTLAPTSTIVPILSEVGAERRMYLPLAALVALLVVSADALAQKWSVMRRAALPVAGLVIVALAARTIARNADYSDSLTLWQKTVESWPQGRARMSYATELITVGRHDEAMAELHASVADYPDARFALATELAGERKFDESVHELREFIRPFPERPNRMPARLLLGRVLEAQGHWQEATVEFEAVLARDATNAVARGALVEIGTVRNGNGAALASGGNLNAAIAEFQEAVRLNPGDQKAQNNLARALALRPR